MTDEELRARANEYLNKKYGSFDKLGVYDHMEMVEAYIAGARTGKAETERELFEQWCRQDGDECPYIPRWHYVSKGDMPVTDGNCGSISLMYIQRNVYGNLVYGICMYNFTEKRFELYDYKTNRMGVLEDVVAWYKIPKFKENC